MRKQENNEERSEGEKLRMRGNDTTEPQSGKKTIVENAHASGDGSLQRSDEEQNRFPGINEGGGEDIY